MNNKIFEPFFTTKEVGKGTGLGFSRDFYESESPLSIKSDQCMCINVINGETRPDLPFYTPGGSFYMNGTSRFLATVSEEEKGKTRNMCNKVGYESVALVPCRLGESITGLIHVADPGENMVPLETVDVLENVAIQLGTAIQRIWAEEELQKANIELEIKVKERTSELETTAELLREEITMNKKAEEELKQSQATQKKLGRAPAWVSA